ncbi:hypothetical protein M407DRAFT_244188 [Tulasnella calospora MUT 4182]|uniref:Uncharacterized protein n=1 Tax=Tulasnella calospora MUT 4182 TaxID=1051891 RepID=A0A0C3Q6Q6_9AGAM|nr:hypothetical protein M407DRAFT_244188 [Tulasnella calospora MUT 4182]
MNVGRGAESPEQASKPPQRRRSHVKVLPHPRCPQSEDGEDAETLFDSPTYP